MLSDQTRPETAPENIHVGQSGVTDVGESY